MSTSNTAVREESSRNPVNQVLRPIRGRLIAAAVLAALGSAFALSPLVGIAHLAAQALTEGGLALEFSGSDIWSTVILSVLGLFVGLLLMSLGEFIAHQADSHITHDLRIRVMQRLAHVPLGWFTSRSSGEVKQAMQDDIGTLHELSAHFYTALGRTVGAILASLIYLFVMDWRMALVSIVPYVIGLRLFSSAMNFTPEQMQAFGDGQAQVNRAVVEFVNGIPILKTFGHRGKAHTAYVSAIDNFLQAFLRLLRPMVGSLSVANALISPLAVLGVVLGFGTALVWGGWITPVQVLPAVLVAPSISAPLMLLMFITHGLGPAKESAQRIKALLETPVLSVPNADQQRSPQGNELVVKDVSYAYDGQNPVLSKLCFSLKPGTVTAIVGSSGSGKSTVARLLLRFFDPSAGSITLGGVDLRHIDTAQLYQHIGFVLQEVRLIHGSVRENIALGRPGATAHDIERAARAANIHERILALPRGYDSIVGEDAVLSGGEQQRISIARAVLLDPPILVLDEPTAAADSQSEFAIQQALSEFAQGRTLLVIAHRLDTIMHADQILVLEEGRIQESGRHEALLRQQGRYARLWSLGGYGEQQEQVEATC